MYLLDEDLKPQATTDETEPKPRATYSQDWTAYNQAQTTEKSRFQELLFELCSQIDDLPRKNVTGRNRIPLADMVFAVVFKTYSTISCRRFMSDLTEAKKKGFISKIPHFNSLFNYLEMDEMFSILNWLIKESARPMKTVEFDFAVDSSGFAKSTTVKWIQAKYSNPHLIDKKDWLKCHLICGVVTNIVTSVEITDSNGADCPQFEPLVNDTAKRFQINQVSADKAYLSVDNLRLVESKGGTAFIPFRSNSRPNHRTKDSLWKNMYYFYQMHRDKFKSFYHKRSNVETTFSMIKGKFGERLKSKTEKAQINELLCKILCHNICCVIQSIYELGIEADFYRE
jgi:transposase